MEPEKLPVITGCILVFLSLVLGAMMLDVLFNGGTNPRTAVALHVHGIGFGLVAIVMGILLQKMARYPLLRKMAALMLSSGGLLFFAALSLRIAGFIAQFNDALEIVGAALFIGGFVTGLAILDA